MCVCMCVGHKLSTLSWILSIPDTFETGPSALIREVVLHSTSVCTYIRTALIREVV